MNADETGRDLAPQRWVRPEVLRAPPGFWKQQVPGKTLRIGAMGDVDALRALLRREPGTLDRRGSHGRTLLWEAARAGKLGAVRFLLEAGADPNLTGSYNSECTVQLTPLCAAVYYRRAEVAACLRPRSAPQDIFRLACLGEQQAVLDRLRRQPELLDAEDPHDAIYFVPLVAFPMACGHEDLLRALLARGPQLARYSAQLLELAAARGRTDWIDLLLAGGADIRATASSAFLSDAATVRHLLARGAPVNRVGANGFTPLIYVTRGDKGRRIDLIRLLLDHGAQVDATGPKARTALHYAAAAGDLDKIALLLARGANRALRDADEETPRSLALKAGKAAAADLLT